MARLFDYQNPIWRFMGRLADLFLLTFLWFLCSLPVITAGASTTALYYVALKMAKNEEGYICKTFFRAFIDNLKRAIGIWGIMLAAGGLLIVGYVQIFQSEGDLAALLFWQFMIFALLYLFIGTMVFPLAARLDVGIRGLLGMAFMVSLKNFSWAFLMVVITLSMTALGIFVFWPLLFWGAGGIAYIHSIILVRVIFPKYHWNI